MFPAKQNQRIDVSKPTFEFFANGITPNNEPGVAVWRYNDERHDIVIEVLRKFPSSRDVCEVNSLIRQIVQLTNLSILTKLARAASQPAFSCQDRRMFDNDENGTMSEVV